MENKSEGAASAQLSVDRLQDCLNGRLIYTLKDGDPGRT
jgi:hypothetical protein